MTTSTSTRRNTLTACCLMLLQYLSGVQCETPTTPANENAKNRGILIGGEAIVNGLAGPTGAHAMKVRFLETDFQGLTMEIETDMDQNLTMYTENETIPIYVPFQKLTGAIDCINQRLEEDLVIVSGTIQGTANEPIVDYRPFREGERFMTAVRGNHHNVNGTKDEVGEIANFGFQEVPDLSDCMYFVGSDFELREVVGGHITVY